jgi:hypothetical protein
MLPLDSSLDRRQFVTGVMGGAAGLIMTSGCEPRVGTQGPLPTGASAGGPWVPPASGDASGESAYRGPHVVVIRFGGGARRRETIDPQYSYSPFLCHEFAHRGTLFPKMTIDSLAGVETSHGQGTLYILTGKYERFTDVKNGFLKARFEAKVPTIFEYLRKSFNVPEHQTLIVNGEDRTDEEFYTFSNHHLFGAHYRSNVLSLYRFKTYLLRRRIETGQVADEELRAAKRELARLEALDYRRQGDAGQSAEIAAFWEDWRQYYGESGLVNPRGDRVLTELAIRALRQLRPKLMMINYNDCDYVHWGNISHYTRAISIMDLGLKQLVETIEADPEYRDNTVFVVVPDCGRDSNPGMAVPCQHHFGGRSSHEIFALLVGPGIDRGRVVDRPTDQISLAATVGQVMGFEASHAEGSILAEAFA